MPNRHRTDIVVATTDYEIEFPAIVHANNIWATQFHPEKSQKVGEQLLDNFARHMKIYPAIDILGGKAVRLKQGRKERRDRLRRSAWKWRRSGSVTAPNGCTSSISMALSKANRKISMCCAKWQPRYPARRSRSAAESATWPLSRAYSHAGIQRVVLGTAPCRIRSS